VAVPASATHSAMKATTIDGDGRRRRMRLIRSPFPGGFAEGCHRPRTRGPKIPRLS
jgi:hypothetical protein